MGPQDFGTVHLCYTAEGCTRVGETLSLRPLTGETNEQFELRIDAVARGLLTPQVERIDISIEVKAGMYVAALLVTFLIEPVAVKLVGDERVAGGRFGAARGARGAQRRAEGGERRAA